MDTEIRQIQDQLAIIQQSYINNRLKAVVVLEGVDAAGKGGLIRRLAWAMDPRSLHVWPIASPNPIEKQEHFLQRFWRRLPEPGSIAVFDRSWYGRVLVERVEKFASQAEWARAYEEINQFEKQLSDSGIRVIKILLKISKKEQARRFRDRIMDPKKHWKLTFEDYRNRKKWKQYEMCYEDMINKTNQPWAKWHVIESDDKQQARFMGLSYIAQMLSKNVKIKPAQISKELKNLFMSTKT